MPFEENLSNISFFVSSLGHSPKTLLLGQKKTKQLTTTAVFS